MNTCVCVCVYFRIKRAVICIRRIYKCFLLVSFAQHYCFSIVVFRTKDASLSKVTKIRKKEKEKERTKPFQIPNPWCSHRTRSHAFQVRIIISVGQRSIDESVRIQTDKRTTRCETFFCVNLDDGIAKCTDLVSILW